VQIDLASCPNEDCSLAYSTAHGNKTLKSSRNMGIRIRYMMPTFCRQPLLQGRRLHLRDVDGLQCNAAVHCPRCDDTFSRARHQPWPRPTCQTCHPPTCRLSLRVMPLPVRSSVIFQHSLSPQLQGRGYQVGIRLALAEHHHNCYPLRAV